MKLLIAVCCLLCKVQVKARDGRPPQISVPQGNKWSQTKVYVRKASPNTFECLATAEPQAKYYWTVNGTAIVWDTRVVAFDKETGTLTTGPLFGELHTGDYQCFAANKYGTAMTPILKIIATVANTFKGTGLSTTDLEVDVSKYFKLECKDAPYSVPQWQFGWQKGVVQDGKLKANPVILTERFAIDKKGNLHFLWAEKTDNGSIYGCTTVNMVSLIEVSNTQTIRLTVNDGELGDRQPELKYHEDVQVLAGDDAELMCIFTYYSIVGDKLTINWFRNGVNVGEGYTLNLDNVLLPDDKQNQEGEYICEAKLGSGSPVYGRVNLKIVAPPRFVKAPETKSVPIGNDAVFNCEATSHNSYSDPPVWFVNAVPLIGCHDRQFECSKLRGGISKCIKEILVCDNILDCSDGSDESNCRGDCGEGKIWCNDKCASADHGCKHFDCEYPGFLCKNKRACLTKEQVCDGNKNCADGSDERACPGGAEIQRQRWQMPSDRKRLVLPNVTLDDTLCVQCLVRNEYGSTIGNACVTVIDKIVVIKGPNSTYDVEPGMSVLIEVQATTDKLFLNQMKFKWQWYEEQMDDETGIAVTRPVILPPKSSLGRYIRISQNGKSAAIQFPDVHGDDQDSYNAYNALKDRLYTLIIEHQYDRVELNFTINGINSARDPDITPIFVSAAVTVVIVVSLCIVFCINRNRKCPCTVHRNEHQAGFDQAQELNDRGIHDNERRDDSDDDNLHSEEAKLHKADDDATESGREVDGRNLCRGGEVDGINLRRGGEVDGINLRRGGQVDGRNLRRGGEVDGRM